MCVCVCALFGAAQVPYQTKTRFRRRMSAPALSRFEEAPRLGHDKPITAARLVCEETNVSATPVCRLVRGNK
jgi:hypothetical protein